MSNEIINRLDRMDEKFSSDIKEIAKQCHSIEIKVTKMEAHDETQNKLIEEHIEGVKTNRRFLQEYQKITDARLSALEKPRNTVQYVVEFIKYVGGAAGALWVIIKVYEYISNKNLLP